MVERQEIYCHACEKYVQFDMDLSLDGNHVLICPNCGHEHCRVVKKGVITDDRWDQRNGPSIMISASSINYTSTSTFDTSSSTSSYFIYTSWTNTTVMA